MTQDILITPGSGEPQILFRGSGTTAIELNVLPSDSSQSATGSGTALSFEGTQGQLFSITDNLSSGTIFSVSDVTGLPLIEATASGDVKFAEYGREVLCYRPILISGGAPTTTTDRLYNDNGTLKFSGNTILAGAAQTAITSMLATDLKIGEDDQTKIDFETADTINFYAGNEKQLILTDGALTPGTNAIVDLGTDALEFKDGYFDGTLEADAITIGGTNVVTGSLITTLGTISAGVWQGTAIATTYIADNAITLAKLAGGTDGQIITFDANGDPVAVGPGTDGQVLTSTGAGSPPAFEDASGGGGGGGSMTTVKSNGSAVGGTDIVTLDFSSDFGVAETPDTEINITIGTLNQNTTGSAATLTTPRAINGVNFDGSAGITVTAAGSTLSDTVTVAKGGTNATSFADKSVIISQDSGTDTLSALALSTNGQLVIGGTSGPAAASLASAGNSIAFTASNGGLNLETVGGGSPPSDERLKENVVQLQYSGLETIQQLNPVEFDWKSFADDEFPHQMLEGHDIGLIAQEVEGIVPEVIGSRKEFKTVGYAKLVVILIKAVQELKQEVEALKPPS